MCQTQICEFTWILSVIAGIYKIHPKNLYLTKNSLYKESLFPKKPVWGPLSYKDQHCLLSCFDF